MASASDCPSGTPFGAGVPPVAASDADGAAAFAAPDDHPPPNAPIAAPVAPTPPAPPALTPPPATAPNAPPAPPPSALTPAPPVIPPSGSGGGGGQMPEFNSSQCHQLPTVLIKRQRPPR